MTFLILCAYDGKGLQGHIYNQRLESHDRANSAIEQELLESVIEIDYVNWTSCSAYFLCLKSKLTAPDVTSNTEESKKILSK